MTDALEEKIVGGFKAVDQRFSAIEREQNGIISWLERLSASVEKLTEFGGALVSLQTRQAHIEARQTDMALDIDNLDGRMSDIESNKKVADWRNGAIIAILSSIATAIVGVAVSVAFGAK